MLGTAIVTAPAVLDALDGVEWSLLDSVRALVGHEVVGERASRLVTGVAQAAHDDQYTRDLIPVLGDVRGRAVALGSEAARLAAVARPAPVVPDPEPLPVTPPATPSVTLTPVTAVGAAAAQTAATVQRRVVEAGELDGLVDELRAYARRHPSGRLEVTWRALEPDDGTV